MGRRSPTPYARRGELREVYLAHIGDFRRGGQRQLPDHHRKGSVCDRGIMQEDAGEQRPTEREILALLQIDRL